MKLGKKTLDTNRFGKVGSNPQDLATKSKQGGKGVGAEDVAAQQSAQKPKGVGANKTGFDGNNATVAAMNLVGGHAKGSTPMSKAAKASVIGLDTADQKSSVGSKLRKGIMGMMTGVMLATSMTPALAQDATLGFDLQPQAQSELSIASFGLQNDGGLQGFDTGTSVSPWQTRLSFDNTFDVNTSSSDHSPAVQAAIDTAFDRFETRMENVLTPSGLDMARSMAGHDLGFNALTGEGTATPAQENAVKDALKDLLSDLPVAAFSDGAAQTLTNFFTSRGVSAADLEAATLSDFGDAGGDVAKQMVKDFREDSPVAFYSLATVLAGGAGAAAYFQGSDALESIGLSPEFSTRLFGNTKVSLGTSWDEKFTNPALNLGFENVIDFDSAYRLTTTGDAYFSGSSFSDIDLDAWRLSSTFHADDNHTGIRVYAQDADTAMHGIAQGFQVGTSAWYRTDDFRISGGADYNAFTDNFSARLSAEYEPNENMSFGLYGTHDSQGDSQISIGGAIRF